MASDLGGPRQAGAKKSPYSRGNKTLLWTKGSRLLLGQWQRKQLYEEVNPDIREITEEDVSQAFGMASNVKKGPESSTIFTHNGIQITAIPHMSLYYKIHSIEVLGFELLGVPQPKKLGAPEVKQYVRQKKTKQRGPPQPPQAPVSSVASSSSSGHQISTDTRVETNGETTAALEEGDESPTTPSTEAPLAPTSKAHQQREAFARMYPRMTIFDPSVGYTLTYHAQSRIAKFNPSAAKADAQKVLLGRMPNKTFLDRNTNRAISEEEVKEALTHGRVEQTPQGSLRYTHDDIGVITNTDSKVVITVYRVGEEDRSKVTSNRMLRRAQFAWHSANDEDAPDDDLFSSYSSSPLSWYPSADPGSLKFDRKR